MLQKLIDIFHESFVDEELRQKTLFNLLNIVLAAISLVMTVVNLVTGETTLMYATLVFFLLCVANYVFRKISHFPKTVIHLFFSTEVLILLGFFIVTGIPQGFSVLWTLLVPCFALSIFGRRGGSILSALTFTMVIFFFWCPMGTALLQYAYSPTFMLRFPFVYLCMIFIAVYLEAIRHGTYSRLKESERSYRFLYRHDALTGLFSRHAFYEELDRIFQSPTDEHMAILIFDIDDFKRINDRHGHNAGDAVLQSVSVHIQKNICEHCIACRWGDEEFLVLMQCRHNPFDIADRIRAQIEAAPLSFEGASIPFTVSAGVSTAYTLEKTQVSDFINRADKAMYLSKTNGKNRTTLLAMEESKQQDIP